MDIVCFFSFRVYVSESMTVEHVHPAEHDEHPRNAAY
jgi:hypothetical protein